MATGQRLFMTVRSSAYKNISAMLSFRTGSQMCRCAPAERNYMVTVYYLYADDSAGPCGDAGLCVSVQFIRLCLVGLPLLS